MDSHILVVDDDTGIRRLVEVVLKSEGYAVELAADGRAALEAISRRRPAVVLLDLQMPVMTGWEVHAALRLHGPRVPVVFMTAGYRAQREAETHGADGCLSKPFELEDLLDAVARFAPSPMVAQGSLH